jgi:hypothetical protein
MILRRIRLAALLGLALLAGCTASFTYNHLDWLIPWYVEDYIDLTRDQRKSLRFQLGPALHWHRCEELARYIGILDGIGGDLQGVVSPGTVQGWIDEILAAAERAERSALEVALEFGEELTDSQIDEFIGTLWERQREYEEEYLERTDEQYRQDNYETLSGFLERFTGDLEPAQEQRLRDAAADMMRFDRVWLAEREQWLRRLEPLLQREDGWQGSLMDAYFERRRTRTPEYHEYLSNNMAVVRAAIADTLTMASAGQRGRALEEIGSIRARLVKLTADDAAKWCAHGREDVVAGEAGR